jgi:hypothetical protein
MCGQKQKQMLGDTFSRKKPGSSKYFGPTRDCCLAFLCCGDEGAVGKE